MIAAALVGLGGAAPSSAMLAGHARKAPRTVQSQLKRLRRSGAISATTYHSYLGSLNAALSTEARLHGTRAIELQAVIQNLQNIAAAGFLTPTRLPALFLTLDRNRQWWSTGHLLATYQRISFPGSQLVWEYYPGQGIELQVLGSFSTANALCNGGGQSQHAACAALLSELIPLAANRAGGPTWEYYFQFDQGMPPWTSAMSQGTALQALANAYRALHDPYYLTVGNEALAAFTVPPPRGVAVPTSIGTRYVQYTFDPSRGHEVINAFLQSLIGLDTYAQVSSSPLAARLFAAGNAEAQAEVPQFDTGAWSLYQPGVEDDLSYHELVTGFLAQLCKLTKAPVYCLTASHFQRDLTTPPALTLLTKRLTARRPGALYFTLSKISRVGITIRRGTSTLLETSATFPYGTHSVAVPAPPRAGSYTVSLDATDLAGNHSEISGSIRVARRRRSA